MSSPLPPPKKNLTARQSAMTVNADPTAVSTIAGPVTGNTAAPLTRRKGGKEVVINAPTVGKVVGGDATALTAASAASTALPSSSVQHSAPETSNAKANPVPVLPSGRLGKGKNKKYIDGTESITSSIPISRSGGSLKSEEGSLSTTTSQHILLQQEGGVEGRENPNGQDSQIKDINITSTRVPVILSYAAAASKNAMAGTDIQHKDSMAHLSSSNSKEGGRLTEAPSSSSSPLLLTAGLHSFQSDQGTAVGHLNRNIGSATASFVYSEDQDTMFAQERGDGGLVKG